MRKIQEVLRLKWDDWLSHRAIARSCSISPTTVGEYIRRALAARLTWPLPESLDEDQLNEMLFPRPAPLSERLISHPDWEVYPRRAAPEGRHPTPAVWLEYREAPPDGYGHSLFCHLYRA